MLTLGEPIFISPVTLAELRFGAEITSDGGIRQRRVAALRRLERKPLLSIDRTTRGIFGSLAAKSRQPVASIGTEFRIFGSQARLCNTPTGC
jgi:predicted nucleic acid-binding protein